MLVDILDPKTRPAVVDLFAGGGGLSAGFERAGFGIVQAVESNSHAVSTYRHNHPHTDLIDKDIQSLDPTTCLDRIELPARKVFALIGGPPCQGFSESNRRTRNLDNPRNKLYQEYLRFLEVIKPTWFVMENVAGLRTLAEGSVLNSILEKCTALGYTVSWQELNAADYGVPQLRRRIFIVGNNAGLTLRFPQPTHGTENTAYVTVDEAISDLPDLDNGASVNYLPYKISQDCLSDYQGLMRSQRGTYNCVQGNLVTRNSQIVLDRYKYIGCGQNWESIPPELLTNYKDFTRCHTGIYYRLEKDTPAKVIGNFRKNMLIHPVQHRGLSIREAARLQSFSDNHVFLGSIGFQQQQVADAVPPLLAEAVAKAILQASA